MPFKKTENGVKDPNINRGGRKKGSLSNKKTVKETYQLALEQGHERLIEEMNKLKGSEYIKYYIQLSKFVLPTLKSQEIEQKITMDAMLPSWIQDIDHIDESDLLKSLEQGNDD